MRTSEAEIWQGTELEENVSLLDAGTWIEVELPEGATTIDSNYVSKCKRGADGEIVRYKARYVAKGFTQRPVRDFEQTYALTGTLPNL